MVIPIPIHNRSIEPTEKIFKFKVDGKPQNHALFLRAFSHILKCQYNLSSEITYRAHFASFKPKIKDIRLS